jgi:hypothetical protein
MTPIERRRQKRTLVNVPVKLRPEAGTEQTAITRDLSSSGIFIYTDSALEPGARLELVMMLPSDIGFNLGGWALCQASVVRVEQSAGKTVGLAATFDRVELLPQLS